MSDYNSYLKISVADSGIGISPDNLDRVFDEFEQIPNSKQRVSKGTGLGLPLSKRLIEMHNGKMWAESEGEGMGSTFFFYMPITDSIFQE